MQTSWRKIVVRALAWVVIAGGVYGCRGDIESGTARAPAPAATTPAGDFAPDRLVVKLRPNGAGHRRSQSSVDQLVARLGGLSALPLFPPPPRAASAADPVGLDRVYLVRTAAASDLRALARGFAAHPDVEYAEPDYVVRLSTAPDDPYYASANSWGQGYADLWGLARIGWQSAWDQGATGEGVVVAVIDTGVFRGHPELSGRLWVNPGEIPGNGIDDDGNGYIDDVNGWDFVSHDADPQDGFGHGTHVAGTIAAAGNNDLGIIGVAPGARIMAVKGLSDGGSGFDSDLALAVRYAADNGARVSNNSWGGAPSDVIRDAFAYAYTKGMVSIVAAGNNHSDAATFGPANLDTVITVAAGTPDDQRAWFSNYGAVVDVMAPGGFGTTQPTTVAGSQATYNILSTMPDSCALATELPWARVAPGYWRLAGTSMATPHVAGVAALIIGRHPSWLPEEVRSLLRMAVDPVTTDHPVGSGRISVREAMCVSSPPPTAGLAPLAAVVGGSAVPIQGTARGGGSAGYRLELGSGVSPASWTLVGSGPTPVVGGLLGTLNAGAFSDGVYTLRLTVGDPATCTTAVAARDLCIQGPVPCARETAQLTIDNLGITAPLANDIVRKGDLLELRGVIRLPYTDWALEYGEGQAPTSWSRVGIVLPAGRSGSSFEGLLGRWDTSQVAPAAQSIGNFYTLRLLVTAAAGGVREDRVTMVYLDDRLRRGWPQHLPARLLDGLSYNDVQTADLDGDGQKEIIVGIAGAIGESPEVRVFRPDGSVKWSVTLPGVGSSYSLWPVVADVNGDGRREVIVVTQTSQPGVIPSTQSVFAIGADGTLLGSPWPARIHYNVGFLPDLSMTAADLDHDGRDEIILVEGFRETLGPGAGVFLIDASAVPRRIANIEPPGTWIHLQAPAVGNFDGDPDLEFVISSGEQQLIALNRDGSTVPGWPIDVPGRLFGSPAVADLDGDGRDDVVVTQSARQPTDPRGVYAYGSYGQLLPGWPQLTNTTFQILDTTPALADLDGDGRPEVVVAASYYLYVFNSGGGLLSGWPQLISTNVGTSLVLGDVDGDGRPDVLAAGGGIGDRLYNTSTSWMFRTGGIHAFHLDGSRIDLNPSSRDATWLYTEWWAKAAPVIDDLDGDGLLELVGSSNQDLAASPTNDPELNVPKGRRSIFVWNLGATYTRASAFVWPQLSHDAGHSGRLVPVPPLAPLRFGSLLVDFGTAPLAIGARDLIIEAGSPPLTVTGDLTLR
jgi:subtilisin family serine protease